MVEPCAHRTLVKSPPELWAEISDDAALARHLGAFGEIRITRRQPETAVAWEGDAISGTVKLEPAGWGTKVTLTATPAAEIQPAPEPGPEMPPLPMPAPELPQADPPLPMPEPDIQPAPQPDTPGPDVDPLPPAAEAPPETTRRGFWARLFGRRAASSAAASAFAPATTRTGEPQRLAPYPHADTADADDAPQPSAEASAPLEPAAPAAIADEQPTTQIEAITELPAALEPSEPAEPTEPTTATTDIVAALTAVLDDLGAAHHRPFSRF